MAEIKHVTDKSEFDKLIRGAKPVLVDFFADWCGPCQAMTPIIEELADPKIFPNTDQVEIVKVNVDSAPQISQEFGVMSIPTLIIFKDGKPADTMVGMRSQIDLISKLDQAINQK